MGRGVKHDQVGFRARRQIADVAAAERQGAARGGCWFSSGAAVLHLGVEASFAPARKAHPALLVDDLDGLATALTSAGCKCIPADGEIPGVRRFHTSDPFGNRIEFQQV